MNKRRIVLILAAVMLLSLLLAGSALAARSGTGSALDPYIVDSAVVSLDSNKTSGDYYVTVGNLYSNAANLYGSLNSVSNSYAIVRFDGTTAGTVTSLNINSVSGSQQYVKLTAVIPSELNSGYLTVAANGNTVTGTSATGSHLTVDSGSTADVKGTFASLDGTVKLVGDTTVHGGSASITGNGQALTVNSGTLNVSGNFASITVNNGSVTVNGDTYTEALAIVGGGVKVSAGNTLCVGGNSVKRGEDITFNTSKPWGTLQAGAYDSVVGAWTLSGSVTINGTACAINGSHSGGAVITPAGHGLTVTDGTVTTSGNIAALSVTGGLVKISADTTAASVGISGTGSVQVKQNNYVAPDYLTVTLSDGSRAITPDKDGGKDVTLTEWGTLPAGTHAAKLKGAWSLPAGATLTAIAADPATVTGESGTLTVNSNDISVTGSFAGLTVNDGYAVSVVGDTETNTFTLGSGSSAVISKDVTLCDSARSVCPDTVGGATIAVWGALPSGSYTNLTGEWTTAANVTINGTTCDCGAGHNHVAKATVTSGAGAINITGGYVILDGAVGGTVTVSGTGLVENRHDGNTVVNNGGGTVGTGSTEVDTGSDAATITGIFANVSGTNITLAGNTIINGTKDKDDNASYAVITGDGQALTVNGGDVRVKGTFSSITTAAGVHVTLAGDTVILAGNVGVVGAPGTLAEGTLYTLKLGTAGADEALMTAHIAGDFKQITVLSGKVTDCDHETVANRPNVNITNNATCLIVSGGVVTLDNGGVIQCNSPGATEVVRVTGGGLTIGSSRVLRTENNAYQILADMSSGSGGMKGISVSGTGECWFLNGTVDVATSGAYGVYVSGAGARFHLGSDASTHVYSFTSDNIEFDKNTPKILTRSNDSSCIFITSDGEAWLHAGEVFFDGRNSYGVNVRPGSGNKPGVCHVWANDQYAIKYSGSGPRLYIHGGLDAVAAMWVANGAKFDIRGRGVLFEEPRPYADDQYALYIGPTAIAASDYPLSGGTFNGDVWYDGGSIADLLAYNHYLRYDGAEANYLASDGTYGVRPASMAAGDANTLGTVTEMHACAGTSVVSFDGLYTERFGKHGEFYTVTDAEWELRWQMGAYVENGTYQLPAGIVRGGRNGNVDVPNCLTLDINVFAQNDAEYTPYWGIEKRMGDVNIFNGGHILYLAGRTLTYTGMNWAGTLHTADAMSGVMYDVTDLPGDLYHTISVTPSGELAIRDCVSGGAGTGLTMDDHAGGYIGTGTVAYELANNIDVTSAINVYGTLNVYSAQIKAIKSPESVGIYTNADAEVNIGLTNEDNDNQLIDVLGGNGAGGASQAIYINGGTVNVNGGVIGSIGSDDYGGSTGIEVHAGTLNLKGGVVTGNKAYDGVRVTGGTAYITGGCVYGDWAEDDARANGDSVVVDLGSAFLKIDEAHKAYAEDVTADYVTHDKHHINNIVVNGGMFVMGAAQDYDSESAAPASRDITGYSRNNGVLLCKGGKTVVYDGVTYGDTSVQGLLNTNAAATDFTTEFYVYGGSFGALKVENCAKNTHKGYYTVYRADGLIGCVQLHGGTFGSIDVSALTTGVSSLHGAKVTDIVGFWSNAFDMDDSGAADWARYNHYATMDSAARDARGSWTVRRGDAHNDADIVPESAQSASKTGGAITVRDGAAEFVSWAKSGATGYDGLYGRRFNLHCNIWLGGDTKMCDTYFHCDQAIALPVGMGAGAHELDTNGFGVFGKTDTALLSVPEGSALNITNSNETANAVYSNLIHNFGTAADSANDKFSDGIFVGGGALTVDSADVTIQAHYDAVCMESGSVTLKAGNLVGKGYYDGSGDPDGSAGIDMEDGTLTVTGGNILGWGYGIYSEGGTISVTDAAVISGDNSHSWLANSASIPTSARGLDAIYSEGGNVTVTRSTVSGFVNGINYLGSGAVNLSNSEISGNTALLLNGADAKLTVTSGTLVGKQYGILIQKADTANISGGTITATAASSNAIEITSGSKTALTVSGSTAEITGASGYGIYQNAEDSSVTVTGTPVISSFNNNAGKATLSGGIYNSITTTGAKLSDIITVAVKDHADAAGRKANTDSVEVVDYVLENNDSLSGTNYATDADSGTATYTAPFILVYAAPPGGGGGAPAPANEVEIIKGSGGSVSTGEFTSEDNGDGTTKVEVVITAEELADVKVDDVMTAVIVEPDGSVRHVPTVVKKNPDGSVTATFEIPTGASFALESEKKTFADAKGKWYEDIVNEMASRLIIEGRTDDVFDGDADITRAEFAALVVKALGLSQKGDASMFNDVARTSWYFGSVGAAYEHGLVGGRGDGIFDPTANITREEAMALIANAAKAAEYIGKNGTIDGFTDAESVSDWAVGAAEFNVGSGFVVGDAGQLRPGDNISRAESATIILRLLQKAGLVDIRAEA